MEQQCDKEVSPENVQAIAAQIQKSDDGSEKRLLGLSQNIANSR